MSHIELGQKGENLAARYLEQQGFFITKRNYRFRKSEIDIIATSGELCIFVEVKTRHTAQWQAPEFAVTKAKQQQIAIGAQRFVEQNPQYTAFRFDVVSVIIPRDAKPVVKHLPEAFSVYRRF